MKILFVIKTLSLSGGGAERVLSAVTAELARRGHDITVATFDRAGAQTFYEFSNRIRLVHLAVGDVTKKTSVAEFVRRVRNLRALALQVRPDVAVGFMHSAYVPLALSLVGTRIPSIGSAHSVYQHYRDRPVERLSLAVAASRLKKLTAISEHMRSGFPSRIARKMVLVGNPTARHDALADVEGGTSKIVLCVGRLGPEKDHATLISAFARIAERFPDWRLRIAGEGGLRSSLEKQVERLSLGSRVELPGAVSKIGNEYAAAQLFVLPSRYESYGLATTEAMMHGLPVIGFADCPGTNEIVRHGQTGLLVPGVGDRIAHLADAMARLMSSPDERKRLGDAGRAATFASLDTITTEWEQLLRAVASGRLGVQGEAEPRLDRPQRN